MSSFDVLSRLSQVSEPELESTQRKRTETRRQPFLKFHNNSWLPLISVCLLIFLLSSDSVLAGAQPSARPRSYVVRTKNTHLHVRRCEVFENQPMHVLFDRICTMCHNAFSHTHPNLHSQCRSDCFKNDLFKKCVNMFSGGQNAKSKNAKSPASSMIDVEDSD